jgi:hypothetical protein
MVRMGPLGSRALPPGRPWCSAARPLDHPPDPEDPTGSVWIRLDRRGTQPEQARCVGPDQIDGDHEPTALASGGRAGRCRTLRSLSGRTPAAAVDASAAGCPACLLPRCPDAPAAVAGVCSAGSPRASDVRQAAAGVRASGPPVLAGCVDLARVTSADERAQRHALPSRRSSGCGCAAVRPQPAGQPDTAAGVWVTPEPDTADALAVHCCSGTAAGVHKVGVHKVGVRTADTAVAGGCPPLQEAVAGPASAGRVPPPPVRLGELTAEPVAKLGADQGHGRSLQRQGFLGGEPAQPQAQ